MYYAGHIFLLIICSNCLAVNIDRIDVPLMVEIGTEAVILDCQYTTKTPSPAGLVMKWFFNGPSGLVYQWIPPLRPQVIGLLKGKVDLNFKISGPAKNFRFIQDKKYVFLVTLICSAQDLYPKPNMTISSQGYILKQSVMEIKMNSWGLYSVAVTIEVHDDEINSPYEEFVCLLSLPNTNYTRNLTTIYYPGLMPTAYTAYEVQRPQHHQASGKVLKKI
ncbi:unnamed protein product [Pieris brassicae]|uniref:Ig-like domain-containing protein n=1 Tax=Pieris brassicae TaxID=7116 RepID=A0A9P0SI11_PIEBR|nr:unnamed protein product [Pieris brassicae]